MVKTIYLAFSYAPQSRNRRGIRVEFSTRYPIDLVFYDSFLVLGDLRPPAGYKGNLFSVLKSKTGYKDIFYHCLSDKVVGSISFLEYPFERYLEKYTPFWFIASEKGCIGYSYRFKNE